MVLDEKLAELSASNAVLVSQSEASNSQLSSLEIILTETKEKLKCDRVRVLEIEGGFKEFRSELDGLYKETKELRMKLKAEKDRHKVEME